MSDNHKDVLIAVYLFEDLAEKDFNAVLKLAEDELCKMRGRQVDLRTSPDCPPRCGR